MNTSGCARQGILGILLVAVGACAQVPSQPEQNLASEDEYGTRNPSAPPELEQFGRLRGPWDCAIFNLQPGGSWQKRVAGARWTFNYALDGNAVTDIWEPDPDDEYPGSVGMNMRVFDAQVGVWRIAWTTLDQARFDLYEASYEDGDIIMWGQRPDHQARVTFFNVRPHQFDWKYEFSPLDDGTVWTEIVRMQCLRPGFEPAVLDSEEAVNDVKSE